MNFAAVILAAGYSSRMKDFKPLLPVGGLPAIERVIDTLRAAGIENILAVTGHKRERLLPVLEKLRVEEVYNEGYAKGMFSSIRTGLGCGEELFPASRGFFLMPVDCPLISEDVLQALMGAALERDFFYVPTYRGKKGHPLLVPSDHVEEICAYDGAGGLKAITDKYWERMVRVPVEEEGCLLDMDTPEGYDEIRSFLADGCRREPLEKLAKGRRIFLVRHGETRQHEEKLFIGQYDVPLSDEGRQQMERLAQELAGENLKVDRIYSSDLMRAVESAEALSAPELCLVPDFREIDLGDWDGQKISVIKEKYPEEYERRGKDLFVFKTGNKAENFYDMQYRAVKALRKILQEDASRDVMIVTHSGVIRALENNLKGGGVEETWEPLPKGSYRVHMQK
ncbi:MAG: histidine phosphatase family protein [Bacillota bacterium]|nr:histidine phosphatase family protein [Bacillota bacterium]